MLCRVDVNLPDKQSISAKNTKHNNLPFIDPSYMKIYYFIQDKLYYSNISWCWLDNLAILYIYEQNNQNIMPR